MKTIASLAALVALAIAGCGEASTPIGPNQYLLTDNDGVPDSNQALKACGSRGVASILKSKDDSTRAWIVTCGVQR